MKFWQKTFIIVLLVFVIAFNLCMLIVMHFSYKEELRNVKMKALGEVHFIASSISKDIEGRNILDKMSSNSLNKIVDSYLTYYSEQGIMLAFYKEDEEIDSTFPDDIAQISGMEVNANERQVAIMQIGGIKNIIIATTIQGTNENYTLFYGYGLGSLEASRHELVMMAIMVDAGMSIVIAIVLYIVLNYLTAPLKKLAALTDKMSRGDYSEKIRIIGNDEFAMLGEKFNALSEQIEEQIEELKAENEKKQLLIDNMAHEFRTPLTSISGYAEYMKVAPLNEDERVESLEYIMSESKRLEKLSKTVLQMADLRETEQEMEEIDINQLEIRIENLFSKQRLYENVELNIAKSIEQMWGNEVLIESLLINLIENSMRACQEDGKVQVIFERIRGDELRRENKLEGNEREKKMVKQGKEWTKISIEDNGVGMSKEALKKIAEPFYRIDKARSRKAGGVGLGVSLCYQIIEAHQGIMEYFSEEGRGTMVQIYIPNGIKKDY